MIIFCISMSSLKSQNYKNEKTEKKDYSYNYFRTCKKTMSSVKSK